MKLLVVDLDGTLYPKKNAGENQFEINVESVVRWISMGNKFAVATARGLHHYPELVKKMGFHVDFIGCNGASVRLHSGEEILKTFSVKVYADLVKYIEDNNIDATAACGLDNKWVWSSKEKYPLTYSESPYLKFLNDIFVFDQEQVYLDSQIDRIQVWIAHENINEFKNTLKEMKLSVEVTSSDKDMIDIGPANSSKGISIIELCNKYMLDKADLVVIGDSENDVPMFEIAGISYCITHADEFVRNAATKTVKSVSEAIDLELMKNSG